MQKTKGEAQNGLRLFYEQFGVGVESSFYITCEINEQIKAVRDKPRRELEEAYCFYFSDKPRLAMKEAAGITATDHHMTWTSCV